MDYYAPATAMVSISFYWILAAVQGEKEYKCKHRISLKISLNSSLHTLSPAGVGETSPGFALCFCRVVPTVLTRIRHFVPLRDVLPVYSWEGREGEFH